MDFDNIECVSTVDEAEIHHHNPHPRHPNQQSPSAKPHTAAKNGADNANNISSIGSPTAIVPASSVNELLECPVCTNSMYPPIHQCPNGHTLCSTCKVRVHNRCPTCRHELGDIRCLALEKIAESLELPCKHYKLGCPEIFPYYNKLKHEGICNYRPYNCPYAGSECSVVGDIPFLVAHLRDDHKVDMHTGSTFNHRYSIVMVNISAYTLKPSSWEWLQSTWHFSVSWATRQRLGTIATALKLEETAGNLHGKAPHEASVIVTGKSGTAMMV
ncbi:hypothetical protein V6N13_070364 [Hibiscus sabdariffa]